MLLKNHSKVNLDAGRFSSIISYLEASNSLEHLYCLLRKKHNLTQVDIAQIINTCQKVVSNYEQNKRDLRTSEILALSKYHVDFKLGAIAFLTRNS